MENISDSSSLHSLRFSREMFFLLSLTSFSLSRNNNYRVFLRERERNSYFSLPFSQVMSLEEHEEQEVQNAIISLQRTTEQVSLQQLKKKTKFNKKCRDFNS
jgi:hypothetical protein